jgi:hypothetical protein
MHEMSKVHNIKFNDFMDGSFRSKKVCTQNNPLYSFSLTPMMLLDPTVCIVGGVIVAIAIVQKVLEHQGCLMILSMQRRDSKVIEGSLKKVLKIILLFDLCLDVTTKLIHM